MNNTLHIKYFRPLTCRVGFWLFTLCLICIWPASCVYAQSPAVKPTSSSNQTDATRLSVLSPQLEPTHSVDLSAELAGTLAKVLVTEGDMVTAGQQLAQLRDESIRLRVSKAKVERDVAAAKAANDIDLRLASKSQAVAETEWRRAVEANRSVSDAIPPNEVDRLRLVLDRTVLEVERAKTETALRKLGLATAENDVLQAELALSQHRLLSPVAAMVVAVEKHGGEWVEPGVRILQLMAIEKLRVQGAIPVAAASASLRERPVAIVIRRGEEDLSVTGKVTFVSPEANPVNGQVRVHILVDNSSGKLRPGMKVISAQIMLSSGAP